jgi:hypothetical protein
VKARIRAGLALTGIGALILVSAPASYAVNGSHPCGVLNGGVYEISTRAQLEQVGSGGVVADAHCRLDDNYLLMNDINLSDGEWVPLPGIPDVPEFSGVFDGNGKTIRNMTITQGFISEIFGLDYVYAGFFIRVNGATITNLEFQDAVIDIESDATLPTERAPAVPTTAGSYVGVLSGVANFPADSARNTISGIRVVDSRVSVKTIGQRNFLGGIVGDARIADLTGILVERTALSASSDDEVYVGGVVGLLGDENNLKDIFIDQTSAFGDSTSLFVLVGGIAGYAEITVLEDIVVERTVVTSESDEGYAAAGGIAGQTFDARLTDVIVVCSDIEAVSGDTNRYSAEAGGIVGLSIESYIVRSYVFGEGTVQASGPGGNFAGGAVGSKIMGQLEESGVYGMQIRIVDAESQRSSAGGLVGETEGAAVTGSLVKDTGVLSQHLLSASGSPHVGGLVGTSTGASRSDGNGPPIVISSSIANSYVSAGSVEALGGLDSTNVGGFVGNIADTTVEYSYVNNTTSSGQEFVGVVGAGATIDVSFFRDDDDDEPGGLNVFPGPVPVGGYNFDFPVGLTGSAMRTFATYTDSSYYNPTPAPWAMTEGTPSSPVLWGISPTVNDGFPYLYWEAEPGFVIRDCSTSCTEGCDGPLEASSNVVASGLASPASLAATGVGSSAAGLGLGALTVGVLGYGLVRWSRHRAQSVDPR